jgi:DNA-binding NtrC family response regulator
VRGSPHIIALGPGLLGASPATAALGRAIDRAARAHASVAVVGEPGTEREAVARAVHERSSRRAAAFVAVRCALLSEREQAEALFGSDREPARIARAHGGTLYLEDVEALARAVQERLAAALALAARSRSDATRGEDFRVVASTTLDLRAEAKRGVFSEKLHVRLSAEGLRIPPLRERGDDVLLLARHDAERQAAALGVRTPDFSAEADAVLRAHRWPGNREELRAAVERAVSGSAGGPIRPLDLALHGASPAWGGPGAQPASLRLAQREREATLAALARAGGTRAAAARLLGVSRSTLYRKLAEHGID